MKEKREYMSNKVVDTNRKDKRVKGAVKPTSDTPMIKKKLGMKKRINKKR